jgi:hypothetical protein
LAVDELSDPLAVALDELSRDQRRSSRAEAVEISGDQWRSVEINGDPLVLRRCGANRERGRGREGERVVTRDGGSGDDGARRVSG